MHLSQRTKFKVEYSGINGWCIVEQKGKHGRVVAKFKSEKEAREIFRERYKK